MIHNRTNAASFLLTAVTSNSFNTDLAFFDQAHTHTRLDMQILYIGNEFVAINVLPQQHLSQQLGSCAPLTSHLIILVVL